MNQGTTPVPFPTEPAPRFVVVFGGTFDPPHRGHIELPARVRDALEERGNCVGGGWLLYVPAARSPHKTEGAVASGADRAEMLWLAIGETGLARAAVWTDEIDRVGAQRVQGAEGRGAQVSFTVETLGRLRGWLDERGLGGVELRLLIGADQALGFHRWRQPRDILRLAKPAVMVRGEVGDARALVKRLGEVGFWDKGEVGVWEASVIAVGAMDISATRVREALRGGDVGQIGRFLLPSVAGYIAGRGLYRGPES